MDLEEYEDRERSSESFIESGGVQFLIFQFLSDNDVLEREKYYRHLEVE